MEVHESQDEDEDDKRDGDGDEVDVIVVFCDGGVMIRIDEVDGIVEDSD